MCPYRRTSYNPLDIYPVMELLGQMELLFLRPWGIATLSSTMVELIYIPINSVKLFLTKSSPATAVSWIFNDYHSNWHEMVSWCGFNLHSSDDQWWWAFFHVCRPDKWLLLKSVCSYPLPTFGCVCLFVSSNSVLVLCRFWILALCQMGRLQKFFSILLLAGPL